MNNIHPSAMVSPHAKLGSNLTVSAHAIIHDDVEIGDDCFIGPFAVLYNGARVGNKVKIYQSASIAHVPQDLKFSQEKTVFRIGNNTTIHEFVTLHRGTKDTGFSSVGQNCLLMAYSHVAHDCVVGDNCILANGVQLAGHVAVEDYAIIGGMTPVHQFCNVGQHTMVGGGFRVTQDVPPYTLAAGEPLRYSGLNVVGLRRRGFSNDDIQTLKNAYAYLYDKGLNTTQALEKIQSEFTQNDYIKCVLEFIKKSKRGIVGK